MPVVRSALATYRSNFRRVACTATILYVPLGFLEAFFVDTGEGYYERHDNVTAGVLLAAVVIVTSVSVAGDAFFAGFLDAAVGEEYHGQPRRSIPAILRTLPYRRLIIADIVLGVTTAAGSLLFLIPGPGAVHAVLPGRTAREHRGTSPCARPWRARTVSCGRCSS